MGETTTGATAVFGERWRDEWRATLGPGWGGTLAGFAILLFLGGVTTPLADADLPMHLALGEWIAQHGAVPFSEPFAWTRAGAPFFAYSWGVELLYYRLLATFGPAALHVLHGALLALAGAAVLALGAAARWSGWTTLLVAALHVLVMVGIVPSLRPQAVLMVILPLLWALVLRARVSEQIRYPLVGLLACSAVAANSHLFFPLTAAPCVVLLSAPRVNRRRLVMVAGAIVLGWLVSPYALHWPEVFRQNLAPNVMLSAPTPVEEYMPGFSALSRGGGTALLVAPVLLFLPWLAAAVMRPAERFWYGLLWVAGLLAFGIAIRGLLPWWLIALPVVGMALGKLGSAREPVALTAQRSVVAGIFATFALLGAGSLGDPSVKAGGLSTRVLPSEAASGIEPIARWLECAVRMEEGGKLLTTYNFGGYARWRLPFLSESIDGRTIFPDSVAAAEGYIIAVRRPLPLPPWRGADLAIVPVRYPVAAVLDTAVGWHRLAITADRNGRAAIIALWVTEEWWARAGRGALPSRALQLFHRADATPAACGNEFPRGETRVAGDPSGEDGRAIGDTT